MRTPTRTMLAATVGAALVICTPGAAVAAFEGRDLHRGAGTGQLRQGRRPIGRGLLSDGPVTIRAGSSRARGDVRARQRGEPGRHRHDLGGVPRHPGVRADPLHHDQRRHRRARWVWPFGGPFDITWNAIEDNRINGGATVEGYDGFWFGFIRNHVNGSVNLNNNVLWIPTATSTSPTRSTAA